MGGGHRGQDPKAGFVDSAGLSTHLFEPSRPWRHRFETWRRMSTDRPRHGCWSNAVFLPEAGDKLARPRGENQVVNTRARALLDR